MTTSPGPLWQQVLTDLERRIASGDITGSFPSDRELTEQYGVSRHTAREAVRRLGARGLVDRQRGRGSFLNDARLTQALGGLYSLYRTVEDRGFTQRSEVLALEHTHNAEAAACLDLASDADLVRLERLRFADDEPLALDSVWFPADIGCHILDADFTHTALYDELRARANVTIDEATETLEPIVPEADIREILRLDDDEALLRVRRLGISDGRPVECRLTIIRGQRFSYTSRWSAGSQHAETAR